MLGNSIVKAKVSINECTTVFSSEIPEEMKHLRSPLGALRGTMISCYVTSLSLSVGS